tara:strand:- start:17168 stop:17371 length:204 start_codon:yes stop_codon:yes gene_type:complete
MKVNMRLLINRLWEVVGKVVKKGKNAQEKERKKKERKKEERKKEEQKKEKHKEEEQKTYLKKYHFII